MSVNGMADEQRPLLSHDKDATVTPAAATTAVYTRRWYILFLFCLTSFNGDLLWNTWGPITESAEAVFGWDDGNIGMLANFGNIFFMIFVLPTCWLMDEKGLRWAMVLSPLLALIGAAIRCISFEPTIMTWTANICACVNGIAGCVCYAGPSLVYAVWFPPGQRGLATGIMSVSTYFGFGMAFIVDITNIQDVTEDIKYLMYLHGGLCVLGFVLNLVYFPSKPPKPPSVSASLERTQYLKGLKQLLRMRSVWLIVLAFSLPVGVLQVWATVLDVILKPLGITQKTAGFMGFSQTMAGCAGGIVISRFADIFMRRTKLFLICMYIGGACMSVWLTLLCQDYIPLNIPSLYAACILVGVFVNGAIPLFYEISCEASYPVAEGVTVGWLTLVSNVFGSGFLLILLVKSLGTSWMNWVLTGSILVALPLLFSFRETYRRTDLDIAVIVPAPT